MNMYGKYNDSRRLPLRPRLTITPVFDSNNLYPELPPIRSRNSITPMPRWSHSPAKPDLLARPSSTIRDPLPMAKRIPVSRKYVHVQSKVAQLWQGQNLAPPPRTVYEKPQKIPSIKNRPQEVKLNAVGDDVIQNAIDIHVRRLSQVITPNPFRDDNFDENLNVTCEMFGIKDFLNTQVEDELVDDIGKALAVRPPDYLDCHLVEMIIVDTPPPLDDVGTPTPPPEIGLDGFPDECMEENYKQSTEQPEVNDELESLSPDSEISLTMTNASTTDSIPDPDPLVPEMPDSEGETAQIDKAVNKLLTKLSAVDIQENQINMVNGDDSYL